MVGSRVIALAVLLALCAQGPASAQRVAAVLSSGLAPYERAFKGFSTAVGEPVVVSVMGRDELNLPPDTRVVVTFGSKASLHTYPKELVVVTCMAPAAQSRAAGQAPAQMSESARRVRVHMLPAADQVLSVLHNLQPHLRQLATISVLDISGAYLDCLQVSAQRRNTSVHHERLRAAGDLPAGLRRLTDLGIDALWLPPDPLLINPGTFAILKEFSRANKVPFYAPTAGFVAAGAVASIAPNFEQIGAMAARVATDLLQGRRVADDIFPMDSETTVNAEAARRTGLAEADVRRLAHRIIEAAE